MPYLGLLNEDEGLPPEVLDGSKVECPACGEEMSVLLSYNRGSAFVSRHFSHEGGGKGGGSRTGSGDGDCPGESEMHHKMMLISSSNRACPS